MRAFILAGGFATRLWPLTEKRAKPLLPLAGKPIVSFLVEQIPTHVPITVSTNAALADGFEEWKKEYGYNNVEILIEDSANDDQKLGALGAVAQWITQACINDDVLLMTGDNYCGFDLKDFLAMAQPNQALVAAHDIKSTELAKAFGTVLLHEDGKSVAGFEEKPAEPKTTIVSTGISLLPACTLPILLEYAKEHPDNVGGIFEELLRKNQPIDCFTFSEQWFDIGSFDAYLEATKELVDERVLMDETSLCETSETIGSVVVGQHCTIKNSRLENVVIFDHCTIENCHLENCIIDNHCSLTGVDLVGKMLRAQTNLRSENL